MDGEIIAAAITGAAVLGAAAVAVPVELIRRSSRATNKAIGRPNGDGNVVQMLEKVLAGQVGQDNRIARLEGNHHDLRQGQHQIRQDVAHLAGRVDGLERQS